MKMRMTSCKYLALTILVSCMTATASHAAYPEKPVKLIAPFSAGGSSDLVARALANVAPKYLNKPVLVENKTGAGGFVGSNYVSKSAPDGYTLLLARVGPQAVGPAVNPAAPYHYDDFTVLGLLERNPYVFAVNAESSYKTFDDLVKALKNKPGKLTYSTSGPGTILNMGPQMLLQVLDLQPSAATPIPYKGGGAAATALLGNHVDFAGANLSAVISGIEAGKLRALAVTTPERYSRIPEVPTVSEVGFPKLESIVGWSALYGPPEIPSDVVERWKEVLQKAADDEDWKKAAKQRGAISDIRLPSATRKFVEHQYEVYQKLGKRLGMTEN